MIDRPSQFYVSWGISELVMNIQFHEPIDFMKYSSTVYVHGIFVPFVVHEIFMNGS